MNLTIRQSLAPFGRKILGFSKKKENLEKQGILHNYFTLFEANPRFSRFFPKKCKVLLWGYEGCQKQTIFFQAFYNFARPHMSLREKISDSDERFQKKWRPKTPAMAAGISEHVWEFRELLTYKYVTES
ncbi:hypothetical protein [Desulfobacter latus]|uniref:Uncharacterized protein n=1 Tax=Desulfobacter latus TaxID=2292 RepID=A0A850T2H9_9BACT|nr:hypothetical protein [Desulfobacter latus]NWH05311.1 hypothetical protein [Desulfobacter latus]